MHPEVLMPLTEIQEASNTCPKPEFEGSWLSDAVTFYLNNVTVITGISSLDLLIGLQKHLAVCLGNMWGFKDPNTFICLKKVTHPNYPPAHKGCHGIAFTKGVRMDGGWVGSEKKFVSQKL